MKEISNFAEKSKLRTDLQTKFNTREDAVKTIQSILNEIRPCSFSNDDPYYKKALENALKEKYLKK